MTVNKKPMQLRIYQLTTFVLIILTGISLVITAIYFTKYRDLNNQVTQFENRLGELNKLIDNNFIGDKPTLSLEDRLVKGYVDTLNDKYSEYLTQKEAADLFDSINSKYAGIGIAYTFKDGVATVTQVFPDSPASKAGIVENDTILKIDNTLVKDFQQSTDISNKIRGDVGTKVSLLISHANGQQTNLDIIRNQIQIPQVMVTYLNNVAILKITSFGVDLDQEIQKAATEISNKKVNKIILDLRDNGGGYLNSAVDLISYFVEPNQVVVKEKENNSTTTLYSKQKTPSLADSDLVILVNGNTASASEITALALKDIRGTQVIGSQTYGKGVVQSVYTLSDKSVLKLTIAKWFSPKDNSIDETGITPDISTDDLTLPEILAKYNWDTHTLAK